MKRTGVAAYIGLALALSACGGGATSTPKQSQVRGQTQPLTVSVATPTTTGATTAAQTSAPAGPPPCTAADLTLSFLGGQGATGHGELGFELRNTTGAPCHTYGYPGVQFLDQSGATLPTEPTRTTQDYFGSVPKAELVVAPGQGVSFRLGVTHGIASTAGCTTAYGLQVIPPDDTASLRATISGGAYECRSVTVSPLRPGTSAYP